MIATDEPSNRNPGAAWTRHELQGLAAELKSGLVLGIGADQQATMRLGLLAMITNLDDMLVGIPSIGPDQEAVVAS